MDMQEWYKIFNDYFNFTKGERNAFLLLLFLILCALFVPKLFNTDKAIRKTDFSYISKLADSLDKMNSFAENRNWKGEAQYEKRNSNLWNPHKFNPNEVDENTLMDMGMQKFIASRIIKYRTKVKPFKIKSDLLKIYGFDSTLFNRLLPYIDLPETYQVHTFAKVEMEPIENKSKKIDLNNCDTNELKSLPGIGSKLSKRIIAYRNSLGGFCKVDQLKNVYGLKPETFEKNLNAFYIGNLNLTLNINSLTKEELRMHPCFAGKIAEVIHSYRIQHGRFNGIDDLKKTLVIDDKWMVDCECYLKF